MTKFRESFDINIWKTVSSIQFGQVMGYGEVARAAGFPRYSRMVAAAMGRSPEPLPWYRVVKSDRTLAFEPDSESYRDQALLLKQEGVLFESNRVVTVLPDDSLDKMLWGPID
jgi:methylated-DNA-protein-cysteine methyltransferase-like protein